MRLAGQCMCGAVRIEAEPTKDFMTACNCDSCRRWTGGVNYTFNVDETTAEMTGPIKTIASSEAAERGFCATCGSGLFYRVTGAGPNHGLLKLSAGLFPGGTDLRLGVEYYADKRPAQFDLSQPHETMTEAEVQALLSGS